jgi:hypothetical protein
VNPRLSLWVPPQSPFSLIEEQLHDNPWKLLVACMLLNKTTGEARGAARGPRRTPAPTSAHLHLSTARSAPTTRLRAQQRRGPPGARRRTSAALRPG